MFIVPEDKSHHLNITNKLVENKTDDQAMNYARLDVLQ